MKRFLATFLSVIMVLSCITVTATAEPVWEEWTSTTSLPKAGYYYLAGDVTLSGTTQYTPTGDLHLDLRGHRIDSAYSGGGQGTIRYDGTAGITIELTDTVGGSIVDGTNQTTNGFLFTGGSSKANLIVSNITFQNFKFAKSDAQSGSIACIQSANTTAQFTGCTFKNGSSIGAGGAIYNSAVMTLTECVFDNCTCTKAADGGGAVKNTKTLTINGCEFKNCSAINGGAVFNGASGALNIFGSKFTGNYSTSNGGAVYITNGKLTVGDYKEQHTVFENNGFPGETVKTAGGGAIYFQSQTSQQGGTITNAVFTGNKCKTSGGAIRAEGGNVVLNDSTFTANEAVGGAAVYTPAGIGLTVNGGSYTGNKTGTDGYAVICLGALTISGKLTVKDNTTTAELPKNNLRLAASAGNGSITIAAAGLAEGSEVHVYSTSQANTISGGTDQAATCIKYDNAEGICAACDDTGKIFFTKAPVSIALDQPEAAVEQYDAITLKATVKDDDAFRKVLWETEDTSVISITDNGDGTATIEALETGNATVKVKAAGNTSLTATCAVTVTASTGNRVILSDKTLAITEGQTATISGEVKPSTLENKTINWVSSDESIATVEGNTDGTAVITGKAAGTVTITATLAVDPTIPSTCEVSVEPRHFHDGTEYLPWTDATSLPKSGYYCLATDVTLSAQQVISTADTELHLCLNGHKVTSAYTSGGQGLIRCDKTGVVIEITDCTENPGKFDGSGQSINGAIFAGSGSSVSVKLSNITFENFKNTSTNSGAVICLQSASSLDAENCTFTGNGGCKAGGVIWANTTGAINAKDCTFTDNSSTGSNGGGVIQISNAALAATFDGCTFTGNSGLNGSVAGYGSGHGKYVFKDCTMTGNTDLAAGAFCGAVYMNNSNKKLTIEGSTVIKDNFNSASTPAAADIMLQDNSAVTELVNPTVNTELYFNTGSTNGVFNKVPGDSFANITTSDSTLKGTYHFNSGTAVENALVMEGGKLILKAADDTNHIHDGHTFAAWTSDSKLPGKADVTATGLDSFFLTKDVTLTGPASLTDVTLNLCLNGHKVYLSGNIRAYRISNGAQVLITDCGGGGFERIGGPIMNGSSLSNGGILGVFTDSASDPASVLTVKNVKFKGNGEQDADKGGGILFDVAGATLNVENCSFENFAANNGAGIFVNKAGQVNIKNSVFSGNKALKAGGGAYLTCENASVSGCRFTGNTALEESGGGLCLFKTRLGKISDSTFTNNSSSTGGAFNVGRSEAVLDNVTMTGNSANNGAAIVISGHDTDYPDGKLTVNSGTFSGNTSKASGGAIYVSQPTLGQAELTVNGGTFENNTAGKDGGAIYASRGKDTNAPSKVTVNGGTIKGNKAAQGSAIMSQGSVYINGGTYENNTSTTDGTIYVTGVGMHFEMTGGTVKNNKTYKPKDAATGGRGAGVMLWGRGEGTEIGSITGGTICDNYAENYASLYVGNGSLTVSGLNVTGNKADGSAGGIAVGGKAVLTLKSGTKVSNNTAPLAAGLAIQNGGTLKLQGATFSGNRALTGGGGAIYVVAGGKLLMSSGTIRNNSAKGTGGGIVINATEKNTYAGSISGGIFTGNKSEGDGAAIWVSAADIEISGVTMKENVAKGAAGAINARGKANVDISDSKITDNTGRNGGALVFTSGSSGSLKNTLVDNNKAEFNGGGIYVVGNKDFVASLTLKKGAVVSNNFAMGGTAGGINNGGIMTMEEGSEVIKNTAKTYGGGIYNTAEFAKLTMNGGLISENTSLLDGGGLLNRGKAVFIMNDGVISKNQAATHGGGMLMQSYATFEMNGGSFEDNFAGGTGGAIRTTDNTWTINAGTFKNNKAGGQGGAIYSSGTVTMKNALFEGNSVDGSSSQYEADGGAINVNGGVLTLENDTFKGNSSVGKGGALSSMWQASTTIVKSCEFDGNQANSFGGAVTGFGGGVLTIEDSKFTNNAATFAGGALNAEGPTYTVTGCEFTSNMARQGGAVNVLDGKGLTLDDVKMTGNMATAEGGAIYSKGHTILTNAEITGNTSGNGGAVYLDGSGNMEVFEYIAEELTIGGKVVIKDNGGGDVYTDERSSIIVKDFDSLADGSEVMIQLANGNICAKMFGEFNYEKLADLQYKVTAGDKSLTDPEPQVIIDNGEEGEGGEGEPADETQSEGLSTGAIAGIAAGGAAVIAGLTFFIILAGKKRKKDEEEK